MQPPMADGESAALARVYAILRERGRRRLERLAAERGNVDAPQRGVEGDNTPRRQSDMLPTNANRPDGNRAAS